MEFRRVLFRSEAGNVGDAATVAWTTKLVEDRKGDPGVVGPVARRPDEDVDLELAAVVEADRAAVRVEEPGLELDSVAAAQRAGARGGERDPGAPLPPGLR